MKKVPTRIALRCAATSSVLAAAAWMCLGAELAAYVTSGESLALDQRDVRVFNNFTDPEANSNTTPDLHFPGYTGAHLALWKACAEWGSAKHFEGFGDPHQPGDLGSGGANFDSSWQGEATQVGGPDDNVMSEISGNGSGVLAYCETPTGDGWRIRFYRAPWVWYDVPGIANTSGSGQADLQGVATHEYGHALGLFHSQDGNATMFAAIASNEVVYRSIESDDIAGVQAIYGPLVASKPHIAIYELEGGDVILRGANFSPAGNTVWFTESGANLTGAPVQVANVASQLGGTEIRVALPANAGAGDVLVQRAGSAHIDLSNAFPFNPLGEPCYEPVRYGTAKLTSQGSLPAIGWDGTPSTLTNDFHITLTTAIAGARGLLFYGANSAAVPFRGGFLLCSAPRARAKRFTTSSFGDVSLAIPVDPSLAGVTRWYQFWFEDPGDPFGIGLSDALRVTFCD